MIDEIVNGHVEVACELFENVCEDLIGTKENFHEKHLPWSVDLAFTGSYQVEGAERVLLATRVRLDR